MTPRAARALAFLCATGAVRGTPAGAIHPSQTVRIPGGQYRSVIRSATEPASQVPPFRLDRVPVTNQGYLAFLRDNPTWRRDRVAATVADGGYLSSWRDAASPGPDAPPNAPVVGVSWFAARAYCATRGGRLPTEAEWEIAGAATPQEADGRRDPRWRQAVLDWYARPNPPVLPDVGRGTPNLWGAVDLHGLVWEWVADYQASMVAGTDARLCGAGASGAIDPLDFPAFLRAAFRSSLEARTTTPNLGFRCAYDTEAASSPKAPAATQGSIYDVDLRLRGADGRPLRLDQLRGHPVLASMFFASCPSACPLLIRDLKRLVAELPAGPRASIRVLLISLDPEHDTPAVLADVLRRHDLDPSQWVLSAPQDQDAVRVAAAVLRIRYRPTAAGQFDHTKRVTLLDGDGGIRAQSDDLAALAQAARDLTKSP